VRTHADRINHLLDIFLDAISFAMFGRKSADDAIENAATRFVKPGAFKAVCKKRLPSSRRKC
jgi:hypothetical protein